MSVLQKVEGLTKELYLLVLSRGKTSFHKKFQIHCSHGFTCFDSIVRTDNHLFFGLTEQFYAYALDSKKTCSQTCLVLLWLLSS